MQNVSLVDKDLISTKKFDKIGLISTRNKEIESKTDGALKKIPEKLCAHS